jgi:hypothetical protein
MLTLSDILDKLEALGDAPVGKAWMLDADGTKCAAGIMLEFAGYPITMENRVVGAYDEFHKRFGFSAGRVAHPADFSPDRTAAGIARLLRESLSDHLNDPVKVDAD